MIYKMDYVVLYKIHINNVMKFILGYYNYYRYKII